MFKLFIATVLSLPSLSFAAFGDVDCENQSKLTDIRLIQIRHVGEDGALFAKMTMNTSEGSSTEWVYGPSTLKYIKTAPRKYDAEKLSITIQPDGSAASTTNEVFSCN